MPSLSATIGRAHGPPASGAPTTVSLLDTPGGLEAIAREWDACVLASAHPTPFLLTDWLLPAWRILHPGSAVVVARSGDVVTGGLPVARSTRGSWGYCLAGQHAGLDLVVRSGDERSAAAVLDGTSLLGLGYLVLEGMRDGSPLLRHGRLCGRPIQLDVAPVLTMPGGWEAAYEGAVNGKRRREYARRLRRLAERGEVVRRVVREPAELVPAFDAAVELHRLRWHAREQRDSTSWTAPAQVEFNREAMLRLAGRGAARLALLEVGGEAVAFNLYAVLAGTVFGLRMAFDPAFASFSPGVLLIHHALADASAEGATRVEFMRGSQEYKRELADSYEPLYWGVFQPRGLGHVTGYRRYARLAAARRLKQSPLLRGR